MRIGWGDAGVIVPARVFRMFGDWLSLTKLESCPSRPEDGVFETGSDGKRQIKPDAVRYWNYLGGCHWRLTASGLSRQAYGFAPEPQLSRLALLG